MNVSIRGVELEVGSQWVWKQAAAGTWEPQTYSIIDRYVTPETTFLDIGAWIGPIALYAAHRARRVYAFEPDPVAFEPLRENVALNPRISNIEVFQRAISLSDGEVRLGVRMNPGDSTSSMLASGQGWTVQSQRLETFCREHDVPDPLFIKMDVEGHEYDLLPALMPWLRGRRFVMYLSTHPHIVEQTVAENGRIARLRQALARRMATRRLNWSIRSMEILIRPRTDTIDVEAPVSPALRRRGELLGELITSDRDLILRPRAA